MTIGGRIAQKRKELGLSQEALGEKLCVSRQAIYKWEADAALPEIEKLVALSKLFDVPVGWLLGVEEEAAPAPEQDELTEQQLRMVEEIVGRYLAAQPQPKKPRRWLKAVAALLVVAVGIHLFTRLDGLDRRYGSLNNAMNEINWSVSSQIDSIAGRVEEILKSQNDLTADYGTELIGADLRTNTSTFRLWAVPKTFVDGMSAVFLANSGAGPVEVAAEFSAGGVFSAEAVAELTDNIALSVVFINPDGTRQTQLLDTYTGLFSDSVPQVDVICYLPWMKTPGGMVHLGKDGDEQHVDIYVHEAKVIGNGLVQVEDIQVGVFLNKKLVAWGEKCIPRDGYDAGSFVNFFRLPEVKVPMSEGDELCVAALVTDNYGRQFMAQDIPYEVRFDGKGGGELFYVSNTSFDSNPANWVLVTGEEIPTVTVPGK